jgi:transposase
MIYVGVDIAKFNHCLGSIDPQGTVVQKPVRFTQDAVGWAKLESILRELGGPGAVTIGFEATGHYWVLLAEELVRMGYTPLVFNPILTADAGRTTVRGRKTDEDDCLAIAKVLRDGHFHPVRLPDAALGNLKRLTRHRQGVVERCANLKKHLSTLLDQVFPEFSTLFSHPDGPTARAVLSKAPSARLLASHQAKAFTALVRKASHGRLGLERVQDILATAKASIAVTRHDPASEFAIRQTLQEIALLEDQIATCDAEINAIPIAGKELITTIPGIADVLGAVILAEIGDINAFRPKPGDTSTANGYHRLLAFAGLDPRIRSSGQWTGTVRMSKRGSRALRTAIWRAAFVASRDPAFADIYAKHRVTMKQHQKIALSHVARKIVQAIYGVLRYQKPFDLQAFRNGVNPAKAA